ncbi:nitrite reductase small subunit NirD [Streptomonospora wellingtoniae]|uniref:Nitrite reductase small subunit NirD n=1 Tax=Streptomonospora wellingtoniae TaxID=3075544 RepID=A0ABU2KXJ5_9ACTN|nr:nitrite reductase small subunit NirD [Streptomonospora sp. DSM 45055]MDT0303758.1 nitrite reductase small subunit NirD [Streptomonospora sp. DSM 45055]
MSTPTLPAIPDRSWVAACGSDRLIPERGAAVLLPDGGQVAVFRTYDDVLYAVGNIDPFSGAAVMARGIVGDRAGEPTVASPMLKQVFSLRTGRCLDDPGVGLPIYAVEPREGVVHVCTRPDEAST